MRPAARAAPSQPAAAHPAGGLISSGGQRQATELLAIVADRHRGGLRRCPRLTAGVHLVIAQLVVIVRLLGVLAACQVQLADRGRAVAGAAGGVQGGGFPPGNGCRRRSVCHPIDGSAAPQRPVLATSSRGLTALSPQRACPCASVTVCDVQIEEHFRMSLQHKFLSKSLLKAALAISRALHLPSHSTLSVGSHSTLMGSY